MTVQDVITTAVVSSVVTPHPWHFIGIAVKWLAVHVVAAAFIVVRSKL